MFISGRRQVELDAAVAAIGHGATGIVADASNLADLDRLYARLQADAGRIDVLSANAGGGAMLPRACSSSSMNALPDRDRCDRVCKGGRTGGEVE